MPKVKLLLLLLIVNSAQSIAQQWIAFNANQIGKGSPLGHGFVSFIKLNVQTKQTMVVGTWGFYPGSKKERPEYITGQLKDDLGREKSISFIVPVSPEEFDNCLATKSDWENREYSIIDQTCVHFLDAITKNIKGLKTPVTANAVLPTNYVEYLKNLNRGKEVFTFNVPPPVPDTKPSTSENSKRTYTGGKTGDELGRALLNAMKANNKKAWFSCFSPEVELDAATLEAFDILRKKFQSKGFSDWNQLKFGRVTYFEDRPGILGNYTIEFGYGTDYYGELGGIAHAILYQNKYLMNTNLNVNNLGIRRKR